ncbi:MAG TPA: DNA alkylation repair protein [Saprospiraceae bacterium]|nr:DNA alkylation repair protein [Saprospiraceae bacterium]
MTLAFKSLFNELESAFERQSDAERAEGMKAYMRNQFEFFGIPAPKRKELVREVFSGFKWGEDRKAFLDFFDRCWKHPKREMQYAALDLGFRFKKYFTPEDIPRLEKKIGERSWWDTVDGLVPQILGAIMMHDKKLLKAYTGKWIESDDIWYQRSAILLQLKYGDKMDFPLECKLILRRAASREFFVQKAMGWVLRERSKKHPAEVRRFISENKIPSLAVREGMKYLR